MGHNQREWEARRRSYGNPHGAGRKAGPLGPLVGTSVRMSQDVLTFLRKTYGSRLGLFIDDIVRQSPEFQQWMQEDGGGGPAEDVQGCQICPKASVATSRQNTLPFEAAEACSVGGGGGPAVAVSEPTVVSRKLGPSMAPFLLDTSTLTCDEKYLVGRVSYGQKSAPPAGSGRPDCEWNGKAYAPKAPRGRPRGRSVGV